MAYKPGIDDMRESPALDIIELLAERGAEVSWFDPHVPALPGAIQARKITALDAGVVDGFDAAVIVTPHRSVDHTVLLDRKAVVVDTRNALKGHRAGNLIKL